MLLGGSSFHTHDKVFGDKITIGVENVTAGYIDQTANSVEIKENLTNYFQCLLILKEINMSVHMFVRLEEEEKGNLLNSRCRKYQLK